MRRGVLNDSPWVSRTFPPVSSRPLRGFGVSRRPPCLCWGHPGFVGGGDPSPGGPKAEALGSRGVRARAVGAKMGPQTDRGTPQAVGGRSLPAEISVRSLRTDGRTKQLK